MAFRRKQKSCSLEMALLLAAWFSRDKVVSKFQGHLLQVVPFLVRHVSGVEPTVLAYGPAGLAVLPPSP